MKEESFKEQKAKVIKIVLVGQSGVGKTNLILRFVDDKFVMVNSPTIGIEFSQKRLQVNNKSIITQIWDTAGQQRFRALNKHFYQNAMGAMIIFDLSNRDSFTAVRRWISELKENLVQYAVLLLVGNKCDLRNRVVTVNEATAYAKEQGMGYLQTSAALGTNTNKAFQMLLSKIMAEVEPIQQKQKASKNSQKLSKSQLYPIQPQKKNKKECC